MVCESCGDGRFEYTGMLDASTARLRCLRCGTRRDQAIALRRADAPGDPEPVLAAR